MLVRNLKHYDVEKQTINKQKTSKESKSWVPKDQEL